MCSRWMIHSSKQPCGVLKMTEFISADAFVDDSPLDQMHEVSSLKGGTSVPRYRFVDVVTSLKINKMHTVTLHSW